MNYELKKTLLSWPLFRKPERLQVMLAILLSREEDGSINHCAVEHLPMVTGLSMVTVQRSIQDLIDAGILVCVTGLGIPTQLVVKSLPDGVEDPLRSQGSTSPFMGTELDSGQQAGSHQDVKSDQSLPIEGKVAACGRRVSSSRRFVKPSLEQLSSYVSEKGYAFSPQAFLDYYDSVGWMVGPGKHMKDWKAACRTWNRRSSKPVNPITPQTNNLSKYEQQRLNAREAYLAAESYIDAIPGINSPESGIPIEAIAESVLGSIPYDYPRDVVAPSLPAYHLGEGR